MREVERVPVLGRLLAAGPANGALVLRRQGVGIHEQPYVEVELDLSLRLIFAGRVGPLHTECVTAPLHAEARAFEVSNQLR